MNQSESLSKPWKNITFQPILITHQLLQRSTGPTVGSSLPTIPQMSLSNCGCNWNMVSYTQNDPLSELSMNLDWDVKDFISKFHMVTICPIKLSLIWCTGKNSCSTQLFSMINFHYNCKMVLNRDHWAGHFGVFSFLWGLIDIGKGHCGWTNPTVGHYTKTGKATRKSSWTDTKSPATNFG